MDFYMVPSVASTRSSLNEPKPTTAFRRGSRHRQHERHPSVTFQTDSASDSDEYNNGSLSGANMERELKASIAKLYQNFDCVTDEYDRLFDIVDVIREDYNNTKSMFLYQRYHEYKRLIKNAIRKWRSVEKKNSLAASRKQSNASFAMAINTGSLSRAASGPSLPGIPEENSNSYSGNLNVRLRANKDEATKELYNECTRLEREIFQYKTRNQKIKNLLCKLSVDYEGAKEHALHIWGRYKELKNMILDVINTDV